MDQHLVQNIAKNNIPYFRNLGQTNHLQLKFNNKLQDFLRVWT